MNKRTYYTNTSPVIRCMLVITNYHVDLQPFLTKPIQHTALFSSDVLFLNILELWPTWQNDRQRVIT